MGKHEIQWLQRRSIRRRLWRWRVSALSPTEVGQPSTKVQGGMHMSQIFRNHEILAPRLATLALFFLMVSLESCSKTEPPKAAQETFASPQDAGAAFVEAVKSGDQSALIAIFGPDAQQVLLSGDPVKDKNAQQDFGAAYGQMNRWREIKAGGEVLYVGGDNYPFP